MNYEPRIYRKLHKGNDLYHFRVVIKESDLDIAVKKEQFHEDLTKKVQDGVLSLRKLIEDYIKEDPTFKKTLSPHKPLADAPEPVLEMCRAARLADVGPMAAIAGLFAESIGKLLIKYSKDIIVENGGDIWLKSSRIRRVGIYAANSPFSYKIGLEIRPEKTPLGICTSSGTIGHSLSLGCADAVVVISPSAVLADAVATKTANLIKSVEDLEGAVKYACDINGVTGAVAIIGDKMAVKGDVKLVPMD